MEMIDYTICVCGEYLLLSSLCSHFKLLLLYQVMFIHSLVLFLREKILLLSVCMLLMTLELEVSTSFSAEILLRSLRAILFRFYNATTFTMNEFWKFQHDEHMFSVINSNQGIVRSKKC